MASSDTLSAGGSKPTTLALAGYAAPQFALAALYFPVFVYLQPFYHETYGLSLVALGAILVAARLLDAATDPLMGAISDGFRSRLGRRKVWLAISTPFVCLSVWMAMVPPAEIGLGYVAFWLFALTLSWTMALTPYFAWGGELSTDYAGRASVTAWRETVFLIGTLGAAALYASGGEDVGLGLERIAVAVLIALPAGVALALWLTPEPAPRGICGRAFSPADWAETFRALSENAPFRRFMASHILNSAANGLPPALIVFYIGAVLGGDAGDTALALVIYFASAIAAAPLWSIAARRGAKHRIWCFAMLYASAIFALVPFLGPGDVGAFIVISALTGLAYGADVVLPPAIQADVVDVDTAESGAERTGVYFALWSVVLKGASGIAAGVAVILVGWVGFEAGAANSSAALATLTGLYAVAPILLKLLAVAAIWNFPIDAAAQEALRRRIDASS